MRRRDFLRSAAATGAAAAIGSAFAQSPLHALDRNGPPASENRASRTTLQSANRYGELERCFCLSVAAPDIVTTERPEHLN